MSDSVFTDKDVPPAEADILAAVGRASGAWRALVDVLHAEHPELNECWRYYADGKSWLLKVSRKSQTVFWLSVAKGSFRVVFYFPERLSKALLESGLSDERKRDLRATAPTGKLRPVVVTFGPQRGVRDVLTLIRLKKTLK